MSPEKFAEIFNKSMVNGLAQGAIIFLKAAWPYIVVMVALWAIGVIFKKHKRHKNRLSR